MDKINEEVLNCSALEGNERKNNAEFTALYNKCLESLSTLQELIDELSIFIFI